MTRRDLAKTAMGSVIFNSLHADQRTGPSQGKSLGGRTVKPNIVLMLADISAMASSAFTAAVFFVVPLLRVLTNSRARACGY
jgi:hypothetical protein